MLGLKLGALLAMLIGSATLLAVAAAGGYGVGYARGKASRDTEVTRLTDRLEERNRELGAAGERERQLSAAIASQNERIAQMEREGAEMHEAQQRDLVEARAERDSATRRLAALRASAPSSENMCEATGALARNILMGRYE